MYSEIFMDVAAALEKMGLQHGKQPFEGQWSDNHWMNTPGTLYCGQTDNCGTGPPEAPENVQVDAEGYEVIYRQPVNQAQLVEVISAAHCDPWAGYGADGNLHWSYEKIKEWWLNREQLAAEVDRLYREAEKSYHKRSGKSISRFELSAIKSNMAAYKDWKNFIEQGLYQYLQLYAFFLDTGKVAVESDRLPEL